MKRVRAVLVWRGRRLKQLGVECEVVAPSMTPKRAGDRVKTDRRDARKLARLLRAGELTAVYIPEPTDEAIRDLCRARTDAVDDRRRSRHRLKGFLLRHGYRYQGKSAWSAAHQRYLRELVLPHPAMKVILEEYLISIEAAGERIERCEVAMRELLEKWRLKPAVQALMAMKGFQIVAAMILVSELGAIDRFTHPRQVMAYLGLVPSENTSSDKRPGSDHQMRQRARALVAGGMCPALRSATKVSKELSRRQEGQAREVRAISWRAQNRLHRRYTRLMARRLQRNKAIVAIARELCGFIWELLRTQALLRRATPFYLRGSSRGTVNLRKETNARGKRHIVKAEAALRRRHHVVANESNDVPSLGVTVEAPTIHASPRLSDQGCGELKECRKGPAAKGGAAREYQHHQPPGN